MGVGIMIAIWLVAAARLLLLMYRGGTWLRASAIVLREAPRSIFGRRVLVKFQLPDGRSANAIVGFVSNTSTLFGPPQPGELLDIVYDAANPSRAEAYWRTGLGVGALALVSVFYAIWGGILVADGRRKEARRALPHGSGSPKS